MPDDGDLRSARRRRLSRIVLALLFTGAGVMHFVLPGVYERVIPPYLPAPRLLVLASGVAETLGGIGLLLPRTRRAAAAGLVLLLLAVWPANAQMLLDARAAGAPDWWQAALWLRLPLQLPLMAWVWWAAGGRHS